MVLYSFNEQYAEIWSLDEKDPFMKPEGGESVADVVSRLTSALLTIESVSRVNNFSFGLCFKRKTSTTEMSPVGQCMGDFHCFADVNVKFLDNWLYELMMLSCCSCAILVVSHGDPLQIFQTTLNAAKEHDGSSGNDLASRIQAVKVPSVLSQHRNFALQTAELRAVI